MNRTRVYCESLNVVKQEKAQTGIMRSVLMERRLDGAKVSVFVDKRSDK
jgi:hypothetical protein